MKTQIYSAIVCLGFALTACSQRPEVTADYNVVPLPHEISLTAGAEGFIFGPSTPIVYKSESLAGEADLAAKYLGELIDSRLDVTDKDRRKAITLTDGLESENPEAYRITVAADGILVEGASDAGVFYGIQTLRKAIPESGEIRVLYPAATIADEPLFAYRGAHFDVARHFFPADSVKTYLDMMALHNMNTFHWHLTDDQGWRLEVEGYPQLTEVGSRRPHTIIWKTKEYDSIPVEGYYTRDEIRDIVAYAAERHINIIPEIDLPGHMQAALASYPSLGCTGGPYEVWATWGVSPDVLCAGNDSVYAFLDAVMDEVTDLFPYEYVHIGGDECPKTRWKDCDRCQAKIRELGLKGDKEHSAEQYLQSYVMRRVEDHLAAKGRRIIGWDEILEGDPTETATIMSWRGETGGIKAARSGRDVVMTPCSYLYFDFYQTDDKEGEQQAAGWGAPNTLEKVYSYRPLPDSLTTEEKAHIIGVQANLWTEYVDNFAHAQEMVLPRWAALAEVQWNDQDTRDYEAFAARTERLKRLYDRLGYNYFRR